MYSGRTQDGSRQDYCKINQCFNNKPRAGYEGAKFIYFMRHFNILFGSGSSGDGVIFHKLKVGGGMVVGYVVRFMNSSDVKYRKPK